MIWWLLSLVLLSNLSLTPGQVPTRCSQQSMYRSIEVACEGFPNRRDWEKMDPSTTHLTINCQRTDQPAGMTLQDRQGLPLPKISFFCLAHCGVRIIPNNFFKDLIHLEHVVLDNLPLQNLQNDIFTNSSNLLELTLIRLEHIESVHPLFMTPQNKLTKLHIVQSNLTANQMKPILISVYVTLSNLYWRNNKQKLFFEKKFFTEFSFDNLILENNGIDNTDFLSHTRAQYVSLKKNPISSIDKFQLPSIEGLVSLDLSFTGLYGTFPDRDTRVTFPLLREFIVSHNRIESLPDDLGTKLPRLKVLDVRDNRLTTLPSDLQHMLSRNSGRVFLSDNIFHCNCEMSWLTRSYLSLARQIICRTVATNTDTKPSNQTLATVAQQSDLLCTPPRLRMEFSDQFKDVEYLVTTEDNDIQVYTVILDRSQVLKWRCEGKSDPAPKLKLVYDGQTYKVEVPPVRRYETRTIMTNVFMHANNHSPTFVCRGSNIAGDATVKVRVVRVDRPIARPAKIVSFLKKDSAITQFSVTIFSMSIIFLYLSQ